MQQDTVLSEDRAYQLHSAEQGAAAEGVAAGSLKKRGICHLP